MSRAMLRLVFGIQVMTLASCAHVLDQVYGGGYYSADYLGSIGGSVRKFDRALTSCVDVTMAARSEYNGLSRRLWHWRFWTAFLGSLGTATSTTLVGLSDYYKEPGDADIKRSLQVSSALTGSLTALITGISLATISFSGIEGWLAEKRSRYDRFDGIVKAARKQFVKLAPDLRSADTATRTAAEKSLQDLIVQLKNDCP